MFNTADAVSSTVDLNVSLRFYVLLTVHLSINLDNDQLDAHLLYFTNTFIIILYMFRALYAHHEVELY